LWGADFSTAIVERDGRIITGKGPAAAFEFGYTIVDFFLGEGASQPLREGMIYQELVEG
jgi:4-methyl-5(b-hydroxyethyl)-thiazole monophosphate biosynthesis